MEKSTKLNEKSMWYKNSALQGGEKISMRKCL
jgi:hypothetical protein